MPLIPTSPPQNSRNGGLPPIPLEQHARRLTTMRRSHTTKLDKVTSNGTNNFSPKGGFQPRPLRNIQVTSKAPNSFLDLNGNLGSKSYYGKTSTNGLSNSYKNSENLEPRSGYLGSLRNGIRSSSTGAPSSYKSANQNCGSNHENLRRPLGSQRSSSNSLKNITENDTIDSNGTLGALKKDIESCIDSLSTNGTKKDSQTNGTSKYDDLYSNSSTLSDNSEYSGDTSYQNGSLGTTNGRLGSRSSAINSRNGHFTPRNGSNSSRDHLFEDDRSLSLKRSVSERTKFMGIRSSSLGAPSKNLTSLRGPSFGQDSRNRDLILWNGVRNPILGNKINSLPNRNGAIRSSSLSLGIGGPKIGPLTRKMTLSPSSSVSNLSIRSISPCSSYSVRSTSSLPIRRIFPQVSVSENLSDLEHKEQSPVVFDANLTFVIGCKTPVRQNIKPIAAHLDKATASNLLSEKISDFLKRTDHVMDEWKEMGHNDDDQDNTWTGYHNVRKNAEDRRVLGRSRSATNILIKGFQYFSRASSVSRAPSIISEDGLTDMTDFDELSEMTADLAEEHSTATLATERLDAETQERLRLEKEVDDMKHKNRSLQQSSERLEMELLYARSELNGLSEEDEDGENDGGVYKQRYERVARELEFTKRRLKQQHEDDLEQLVGLKKQLEKKLADAYEEVEEQRQVVGQWKRKVQKLNAETNDLRLLLEEHNARNNLLEKKQRKFDSETQLLHDELRQEKLAKERISREKEMILAEKYTLDNNLADTRLELDLREEKLINLQKELDELTLGGKTEEEVTLLRKQKMELERKMHEQEEELDELAGQTQLLEQAKLRLEMSLEQLRKESKREAQQRDEELEEVRCNAQKKVKALEAQLENEHEERTLLLREKHELDRRLASLNECQRGDRAAEEAQLQRLKRDLKRTKALLRDAQTMIERYRADSTSRAVLRQLRNQLEDAECARSNAVKAKQQLEGELNEVQAQLEEAQRQRNEADDRFNSANRERTELRTQLEENEEELAEVLKKYRSAVQQSSVDQLTLQEQVSLVSELEAERNSLKERLAELTTKLETMESLGDPSSNLQAKKMELKCKELESKLELEQTTRSRLEVQIARLKETVDKLQSELVASRTKEQQAQDQIRKLQRSLRELRDEYCATAARESEGLQKRKELEKKMETVEAEASVAKADLKLAMKRIDDLQSAIQGELEDTLSDHSESDPDSYSSDESIESFLANHKLGPSNSRNSIKLDASPS